MSTTARKFMFTFFRFIGSNGLRTTEVTRDFNQADGMRGLVENNPAEIHQAHERVTAWAESKGIAITSQDPFPSEKHQGKVWLEYRFGGLSL